MRKQLLFTKMKDGNKMPCNKIHAKILNENELSDLTDHQMHDFGRHKCCQCAYNQGYAQGSQLSGNPILDINLLGDSQASSDGRHKSVHQAFSLGYSHGVRDFIKS